MIKNLQFRDINPEFVIAVLEDGGRLPCVLGDNSMAEFGVNDAS